MFIINSAVSKTCICQLPGIFSFIIHCDIDYSVYDKRESGREFCHKGTALSPNKAKAAVESNMKQGDS